MAGLRFTWKSKPAPDQNRIRRRPVRLQAMPILSAEQEIPSRQSAAGSYLFAYPHYAPAPKPGAHFAGRFHISFTFCVAATGDATSETEVMLAKKS
jgi:hypothetical protein